MSSSSEFAAWLRGAILLLCPPKSIACRVNQGGWQRLSGWLDSFARFVIDRRPDAERQKTDTLRLVNRRNEVRSRQVFPMRGKIGLSPRPLSPDHGGEQGASQHTAPRNPHISSVKRRVIASQDLRLLEMRGITKLQTSIHCKNLREQFILAGGRHPTNRMKSQTVFATRIRAC